MKVNSVNFTQSVAQIGKAALEHGKKAVDFISTQASGLKNRVLTSDVFEKVSKNKVAKKEFLIGTAVIAGVTFLAAKCIKGINSKVKEELNN